MQEDIQNRKRREHHSAVQGSKESPESLACHGNTFPQRCSQFRATAAGRVPVGSCRGRCAPGATLVCSSLCSHSPVPLQTSSYYSGSQPVLAPTCHYKMQPETRMVQALHSPVPSVTVWFPPAHSSQFSWMKQRLWKPSEGKSAS